MIVIIRLGDRKTFIGPSRLDSGAYDLTQILPPSAPVLKDGELWFYYTGLKYRANFTYLGKYPDGKTVAMPGRDRDVGAVCLAVLRRDGFISLAAQRATVLVLVRMRAAVTWTKSELVWRIDASNGIQRSAQGHTHLSAMVELQCDHFGYVV